jgi:RNA polymerase sigma-70 factor, ECF subfamily
MPAATLTVPATAPAPGLAPGLAVDERRCAVAETDPREFNALVAEHLPRLRARAMQLCRHHLDPDDLIQDALERAFQAFDTLRDRESARPWLLRIVSNTFFDAIRRQRTRPQLVPLDHAAETEIEGEAASEPLPWEHIDTAMHRAAIDRLPDDMRDTYRMNAIEGQDYASIAAALKIPKSTVGTRLLRARRRLRELLSADVKDAP